MKLNVLLAESDSELRDLYASALARHGHEVVVADNGLDCLQKLSVTRPDVLVLDLGLSWGGADGILAWLREETLGAEVPVVLTATAGCSTNGSDVLGPPVVEVLPKPFRLTILLDSVRAAVEKRRHGESLCTNRGDSCPELYIG